MSKSNREGWFQIPKADEATLTDLVEKHGLAPVLAVLARLQLQRDRLTKLGKETAQRELASLG
jgi:hypothetical protein